MPIDFGEYKALRAFLIIGDSPPVILKDAVLKVEPADDGTSRVGSGQFRFEVQNMPSVSCGMSQVMYFEVEGLGMLRFAINYAGLFIEGQETFHEFEVASKPELIEDEEIK